MKHLLILTVLLGLASSPVWGQSYDDNGQAAMIQQDREMQMQNQQMYEQQQQQAQQQQMQRQLDQQQQEINSYNNAAPIQRIYGNY